MKLYILLKDWLQKENLFPNGRLNQFISLSLKNIDDSNAGVYRKINVVISGADHVPPDAVHVESEMQAFISWYKNEATSLHPVERAARVHGDFVKIHPFVDGNGRTSRLLMNLELMKDGYPPVCPSCRKTS